jgi:integrase
MQRLNYDGLDEDSRTKVEGFLDSMGINSESTRNTYAHALKHFKYFLDDRYGYPTTIGNIIDKIKATNDTDVYPLLNGFVSYLTSLPKKITNRSVIMYVAAVKSYLQFYDIDIIPHKFKHRVRMPKQYREEEQAIDYEDIREILKACNNPRLKAYIYVLATGGMRATEALALRLKDVHFEESPTRVQIRKENKTRTPRHTYISDEATNELKRWIDYKYSRRRKGTKMVTPEKSDDHLIFTKEINDSIKPTALYPKINQAFHQVLRAVNLDQIKEGSNSNRRKIVPNSFRHFVYTTTGDQTSTDYANWLLGHKGSTYWGKKEEERKEIYLTKCMKPLTFLDFSGIVSRTKNIETQVQVLTEANRKQEKEIDDFRKKGIEREDILQSLVKAVNKLKVDKDSSEKKMKEVTKKLEEIEKQEEAAMWAWEAAQVEWEQREGK